MEKKLREEQALRAEVRKDANLEKVFGSAWDEIAEAEKAYASFFKPLTFFERANGFYTTYFTMARNIVRLAMEKPKPNADRLREFRDASLPSVERGILSPAPIYDEFEILKLADSLAQLKEELPEMQEVQWILGGRPPQDVARELVTGTKLKDVEHRKKLVAGGLEAVYQCGDPMIKLALLVDPVSRGLRAKYEKQVEAVETRNGTRIAAAMFKLRGTSIPPDATGTLRLSFGAVKGYVEDGQKIPFQTTFAGLYDKSAKAGNKDPYELPESFLKKRAAVRLSTPINFVSTADSIGGNSGSPLVNRKGEFVGVLFDGNIQSLPTRFVYDDRISRSVMVHAQGIVEALLKIYGAKPLVDELMGRKYASGSVEDLGFADVGDALVEPGDHQVAAGHGRRDLLVGEVFADGRPDDLRGQGLEDVQEGPGHRGHDEVRPLPVFLVVDQLGRELLRRAEGPGVVDQDHPPVFHDQVVPLVAVLVGDEVVEGPLEAERPAEVHGLDARRIELLLEDRLHVVPGVDPDLARPPVALELPLDGRRDHVEPQGAAEPVGGDLAPPRFLVAADPVAQDVLPEGLALDAVLLEGQDIRRRHAQRGRQLLALDDLGRPQEILPLLVLALLGPRELAEERAPGPEADDDRAHQNDLFHVGPPCSLFCWSESRRGDR